MHQMPRAGKHVTSAKRGKTWNRCQVRECIQGKKSRVNQKAWFAAYWSGRQPLCSLDSVLVIKLWSAANAKPKKSTYANDKKRQFRNVFILPPLFFNRYRSYSKELDRKSTQKGTTFATCGYIILFLHNNTSAQTARKLEFWLFFFAQELMWKKLDCQQLTTGSSERSFRHDALNWVLQILVDDCNCWFSSASLQIALQCISPL